ncbi:ABC transporter substrate-binding protein [Methanobacterium alcaliphilum]|uniref:ABC transporter substrate-binding protein n=1 Tax=Methanobacterium alcaliphilum TaxID=392018 RepID=UPI00200B27E7|nr:ABC transporter substrate-binding protein [Methanobacterium alcaliphilum]MCK9151885.1 ABC transporter substrate-binding protein [Methanobacterium alcaliphilum]
MNKNYLILIVAVALILSSTGGYYLTQDGGLLGKGNVTITDMADRNLTIPSPVTKTLSTSPTTTVLVYMLAPDKLLAFNYEMDGYELEYVPDQYRGLSSVGGWFGSQSGSYEEFIAMEPDVVFDSVTPSNSTSYHTSTISVLNERQQKFGSIPVVGVLDTSNITTLNPSIKFLGTVLQADDQATKLVNFNDKVQKEVKSVVSQIPDNEKVKVYYAEDVDGLKTDPAGSVHGQLIDFCGGKNVADIQIKGGAGETDVSLEQVLKWDPEVIITTDPTFFKNVYNNPDWKSVSAVKNNRVYLSPQSPFKWFDRPTGGNMIMGIPWVAKILYPDKFKNMDLNSLVKEFYNDFYHYQLSDDQVKNLLRNTGMQI